MAWLLVLTCSIASGADYRFRLAPGGTSMRPTLDLLDAQERAFIAALPELRVGLNLPDNRPYELISADGEISGIQIEILTHLAQSLGLRLRPVVLPSFSHALEALRKHDIDVMATVGYEPSREAFIAFTLGTAPNPGAIIGRSIDGRFASEPTLNGRRVAIERGYVAQHYVHQAFPEALIAEQPDTATALREVASGGEDFYVGSLLMAMDRLQRDAIAGLEVKRSLVYATGQMHFGVRKDWPLLATALSKGIASLRTAPLPGLQAAMQTLSAQGQLSARPLPLSSAEQGPLFGRSVLRVGAVRGLALLNEARADGGHAGIAADYTTQVAGRLGVAVDVLPFDSVALMLDALRDGRIHLAPFLTRTPGRAKEFAFSQPYLEMPYYIVARSDAPLYWSLDSLRGKRLALAPQHPLRELLAERYADIRIVEASPGLGAMDLVASRQADAAVEVKLFANIRINNDNNGVLRTVAQVEELPAQFHFAASKEAAALIPLVDRALDDISTAERDRMLRRWVAIDFNPAFPWRRHLPWMASAALGLLVLALASAWWMRRLSREVRSRTRAEASLLDALQTKNLYVASASHELRGPLQAVTLALQKLGDGPLATEQRQAWSIAQDSTAALTQLIEDVLDLARFEAGKLVLRPVVVDLPAQLRQMVDSHRPAIESRGLRLDLRIADELPRHVLVDALRLRQLLVNLIGNAIKYTPAGSVTVDIDRHLDAERGAPQLQIVVRDTGIGIAPELQRRLFEPFGSLHAPTQAPAEGSTGLGLAICKRLAEAMGGHIHIESAPGRGTEVRLLLPMPPGAAAPPVAPPACRAASATPRVLLLVDDDAVSRLLMAEMLRADGHTVREAGGVAEALSLGRQGDIHLVISDHQMADGTGLALLQQLARQPVGPAGRMRLVLCSGSLIELDVAAAGIDALLRKPVSAERLRETLQQLFADEPSPVVDENAAHGPGRV